MRVSTSEHNKSSLLAPLRASRTLLRFGVGLRSSQRSKGVKSNSRASSGDGKGDFLPRKFKDYSKTFS